MGDPFRKMVPGQRLSGVSARTWNRLMDAANRVPFGDPSAPPPPVALDPATVWIRNATGARTSRFAVLSIDGPVVEPTEDEDSSLQDVMVDGATPAAAGEPFAVAPGALDDGEMGRAVSAGTSWVQVNVTNSAHGWATTENGRTDRLQSQADNATNASVRIIWKESGTGTKWALVELPATLSVTGGGRDINYFRQVGTSPFNVVYGGGSITGNNTAVTNALADTIQATAFLAPRGGTLDAIKIWLATNGSAGSLTRLALYKATSETNLYPDALLVDSGDLASDAGAAGYLSASISASLDAGALYWICINTKNVATKPVVGGISDVYLFNILGYSATAWTPYFGLSLSRTYGAYPATFPASASPANGTFAIPTVHFSG